MGQKVLGVITQKIAKSRYFSISVDSALDITRTDQLTIIICHVNMTNYEPVECFLTFINISTHTGQNLASVLVKAEVDFNHCRGQTYDNASNTGMYGQYIDMQQILKNKNSFVDYILCACHSLNLVGQFALDCCIEAVSYFAFLHQLYKFFLSSTHQWGILLSYVKQEPGCLVPKYPSNTQ